MADLLKTLAAQGLYGIRGAGRRPFRLFELEGMTANALRFWQEIYGETGALVEVHEKYPVDQGYQKL